MLAVDPMAHKVRLRKIGRSVMFAIPKPILEALDLAADVRVGLSIRGGKLVIDPRRPRYSLDELLAEHKCLMRRLPADHEWVSGRSAGRELI